MVIFFKKIPQKTRFSTLFSKLNFIIFQNPNKYFWIYKINDIWLYFQIGKENFEKKNFLTENFAH